jgi:PKD repeat protein
VNIYVGNPAFPIPPPVIDFTDDPTTGRIPLTVTFTDQSTGSPNGWTWFFGDETYNETWTLVNAGSGWSARYGHSSVVTPDGSIVMMGGTDGSTVQNDVWRSTDNGATWSQQTAGAE